HAGIARMAVHILEGIQAAIGGRHQLDDADARVGGVPRTLLDRVPAAEVRLDLLRQLLDEARGAAPRDELLDALHADEMNHDSLLRVGPGLQPSCAGTAMVSAGPTNK